MEKLHVEFLLIYRRLHSYLCERNQKVTINGILSESIVIRHGVPQGYIKHSTTFHFADDTNLLNISHNYKKLKKEVNKDLKLLVQ